MARKVRLFVEDASQHILLKSMRESILFKDEEDRLFFTSLLKELNDKSAISIHAYVLMPTYFEFLVTPGSIDAVPKFIQSLSRNYVGFYNKKYKRVGTLWEGRYKSSIVEDKLYLFDIMKYIESRPVDSENFRFSSIQKNLFNKEDSIVTFHNLYKALGYTPQNRIREYSKVFKKAQDSDRAEFIAECLERQSVTGSSSFIKRLEKLVGVSLTPKKRGRPKKEDEQKRKKMYKNLVVLDKEKHSTLKVNPLEDLEFARGSAFIPVVANEVSLIAETFPVVFTSDDEPSLVSIVSLGGDSLAIDANSKWITNYVPTFLRRYPFSLAISSENSEQRVVLIDEDSKLFSRSRGKQLFTKSGEQSETLLHAVEFLTVHDAHSTATKDIIKVISDSGILEDREIAVGEGDEKKILVNGFKVVDREKLNALSDDILGDWVRNGIITMIDAHLKSLDNIENLFKLAQQRQS